MGLPCSSHGKQSALKAGDPSSIPGLGRSSGEGNGNPLQYSCLKNSVDRGAWWATVCGVSKNRTQPRDYTTKNGGIYIHSSNKQHLPLREGILYVWHSWCLNCHVCFRCNTIPTRHNSKHKAFSIFTI